MKKILVLCTGNSCRSQMVHGYLENLLQGKAHIYSAGIEIHGVNPRAIQIMKEDGIDISHYTSNHVNEYLNIPFDYIITVCDHARENCPYIPGNSIRIHHSFSDPDKATGSEEEIMHAFRMVRNEIRTFCEEFSKTIIA